MICRIYYRPETGGNRVVGIDDLRFFYPAVRSAFDAAAPKNIRSTI
jgi:hypothetical protein